jgi:hypothetical protein
MKRWALFGLALIGGTSFDTAPQRPVIERGEFRVLEGDFHVHSRFSDGFMSPVEIPFAARRAGLDVVAVTDHNTVFPSWVARWTAERTGGPIVITAEEITTANHHVIALGIEETIPADQSLARTLIEVHRQRGVAIAAHPGPRYQKAFAPLLSMLDGAEVMHPMTRRSPERGRDLERFFAQLTSERARPAAIGSSDSHAMNGLGGVRTAVFVRDATARGVIDAIKAGRTVVTFDDGRMIGDADMVTLLEAQPLTPPERPTYEAAALTEALFRTVGLLALIAVVFFRMARPVI